MDDPTHTPPDDTQTAVDEPDTPDSAERWKVPWDLSTSEQQLFARNSNKNFAQVVREANKAQEKADAMKKAGADPDDIEDFLGDEMARIMGDPWIGPAFLLVAVRRDQPGVSMKTVIEQIDAGKWGLEIGDEAEEPGEAVTDLTEEEAEEAPFDPLPSAPTTSALPSSTS